MSEAGKGKLLLFTRLLQEKLGRLPCTLVKYTCLGVAKDSCLTLKQATHKVVHKSNGNPLRNIFPPKVVSEPDPVTGQYNPFPTFQFTGSLRPLYPLTPKRAVPDSIQRPDYAEDGIPRSEQKFVGRNNIKILTKEEQDSMRKVCRLAREVLDIAAREIRPGITTDHLDEVVHKACIERDVSLEFTAHT